MLTRERKERLLDILKREGRVVAKSVSLDLGLSEDTIRRDLRELAAEGLLQRVHGGALPASPAVASLSARRTVSTQAKAAIGRAAAALVRPGRIVFLDGGTTAVQLVRHLPKGLVATIVTHSPQIAVELEAHEGIAVELIGGRLFRHSMVAVGTTAAESIARIRADLYVMGATGLHAELGVTTGDAEEAAIKRALVRQSAETVVLASREKLGAASPFQICGLGEVDTLVLERGLPGELTAPYRAAGLEILEA